MIADCFEDVSKIETFLDLLDSSYSFATLTEIMTVLYRGYGLIPVDESILNTCRISLCAELKELNERNISRIYKNEVQIFKKAPSSGALSLPEEEFYEYIKDTMKDSYTDVVLEISEIIKIPVNSAKFIVNSNYFESMLVGSYSENYWNQKMDEEN